MRWCLPNKYSSGIYNCGLRDPYSAALNPTLHIIPAFWMSLFRNILNHTVHIDVLRSAKSYTKEKVQRMKKDILTFFILWSHSLQPVLTPLTARVVPISRKLLAGMWPFRIHPGVKMKHIWALFCLLIKSSYKYEGVSAFSFFVRSFFLAWLSACLLLISCFCLCSV